MSRKPRSWHWAGLWYTAGDKVVGWRIKWVSVVSGGCWCLWKQAITMPTIRNLPISLKWFGKAPMNSVVLFRSAMASSQLGLECVHRIEFQERICSDQQLLIHRWPSIMLVSTSPQAMLLAILRESLSLYVPFPLCFYTFFLSAQMFRTDKKEGPCTFEALHRWIGHRFWCSLIDSWSPTFLIHGNNFLTISFAYETHWVLWMLT